MRALAIVRTVVTAGFIGVAGCSSADDAEGEPKATGPDASADAPIEPAADGGAATETCPVFGEPEEAGRIGAAALTETSGLVVSRTNPGVLWANNDSGDTARLFALAEDGTPRALVTVTGAGAVDWEDLAIAPRAGDAAKDDLYAADIGDNAETRPFVTVYRIEEPVLPAGYVETTATATAIELAYDDGRAHNAEALLVDPVTGAIVLVTKANGPSTIFVADPPFAAGTRGVLHARGTLAFGEGALAGGKLVTGASITRDGRLVAVRTYTSAFAWSRPGGASVAEALLGAPCELPLALEIQGETIALFPGGEGFVTTTEGTSAPLQVSRR